MLTYLIDGNNLYYAIPAAVDSPTPRRALIDHIRVRRLAGSPVNHVVIVFDGHDSPDVMDEREYKIIFAKDKSADEVIRDIVLKFKNKRQLIVVSDDRGVYDFARGEGAVGIKNAEFLKGQKKKRPNTERDQEKDCDKEEREKITRELENLWVKRMSRSL